MSSRKKKADIFFYIFLSILSMIFFYFLTQIPNYVNEHSSFDEEMYYVNIGSSSNQNEILEKTKFEVISKTVMNDFKNVKIKDSYNDYIIDLTVKNKIINRENTIAQEVLTLYLRGKEDQAREMAKRFIIEGLNGFDVPKDWRWRNHVLYFDVRDERVVIFNESNLLIPFENATTSGDFEFEIAIYEFQKFYLTFPDGLKETITSNILTGESDGDLNEYIDINYGNKPRVDLRSLRTEFIESEEKYAFRFLIWR